MPGAELRRGTSFLGVMEVVHDSNETVSMYHLPLLREALMDEKKYTQEEMKSFLARGFIGSLYTSSRPSVLSSEVTLKHVDLSQDSS